MNIELRKLSEEQFDEKYYERVGIYADDTYEIELTNLTGDKIVGIVMVSNINSHNGDKHTFIDWVEIKSEFQGKSLFSQVIEVLFTLYNTDEIHVECVDDKIPMYLHMGAISSGISEFTENNMLVIKKDNFIKR